MLSLMAGGNPKWYSCLRRGLVVELNIVFPGDPPVMVLGIYPSDFKLYVSVYSNFIYSCSKSNKMSFGEYR